MFISLGRTRAVRPIAVLALFAGLLVAGGLRAEPASQVQNSPVPIQRPAVSDELPATPLTYKPGARACIAEAVYYESLGTSDRAAYAVAHVILNRREHEEFPDTVCAVVTEGCQFSYRCNGKPQTLADAGERDRAFRTAEAVLEGRAADPTDGALFFHAETIRPSWFKTLDRLVEIGGNIFYR